jgi:hypothetical protein
MSYTQRDDQHRAGVVSSESSRVARLPVPFLAAALDHLDAAGGGRTLDSTAAPPVVTVNGPDLGELDGRGALFVLPVVSEADSPQAREGSIVRRRLVALTGPAQRRLRARVEQAARMQRLALASARSRSARSASQRGVRNAAS